MVNFKHLARFGGCQEDRLRELVRQIEMHSLVFYSYGDVFATASEDMKRKLIAISRYLKP